MYIIFTLMLYWLKSIQLCIQCFHNISTGSPSTKDRSFILGEFSLSEFVSYEFTFGEFVWANRANMF